MKRKLKLIRFVDQGYVKACSNCGKKTIYISTPRSFKDKFFSYFTPYKKYRCRTCNKVYFLFSYTLNKRWPLIILFYIFLGFIIYNVLFFLISKIAK